jgi:hemolysin D
MNMLMSQLNRRGEEQAFLPAALELLDTPPSPLGRMILWTILSFFMLTITWACLGHVDIVAVAKGRIIPSGHSKVIQPLKTGTITGLHVKEGQRVQKGDILVELDTTASAAELHRLEQDAQELKQQILRLERIDHSLREENTSNAPAMPSPDTLTRQQEQLFHSQWREYREGRTTLEKELLKAQAQADTLEKRIGRLQATLPLIKERADDMQTLLKTQAVARHRVLEVQQELLMAEHDLETLLSQRQEYHQAVQELLSRISHHQSQIHKHTLQELTTVKQQLANIEQEIIKAAATNKAQTLYSPVDGVVQQLAVHTLGGVVTPAQELMLIVPAQGSLEVEAMLENKDIGFVQEGQTAEVKIDAFPFTKYGTIQGTLKNISNDAILDDIKGLMFKTQVHLQHSIMRIGKRQVKLTPGMSVTVEIKTGTRRVIEFFLSPLLRYKEESIRER